MLHHYNESTIREDGEAHRVYLVHSDDPKRELGGVAFRFDSRLRLISDIDWYIDPGLRNRGVGSHVLKILFAEFADEIAGAEHIEVNIANERTFDVLLKIISTYGLLFAVYTSHYGNPQYMIPWAEAKQMLERARLGLILEDDEYEEELDVDDHLFMKIFVPVNIRKKWIEHGSRYFVELAALHSQSTPMQE